MSTKFNADYSVKTLASAIRNRRLSLGLTLKDTEKATGVDSGQISRFEAGRFKSASKNLQKICRFLQIEVWQESQPVKLSERVERFASRSPNHRLVIEELLQVLEQLDSRAIIG